MISDSSPDTSIERRKRPLVVAIDGPAASGKSSTAKWVARELHLRHVDSGSIYRAATWAILQRPLAPSAWTEREVLKASEKIRLEPGETTFHPHLGDKDLVGELHNADVTAHVSRVAVLPGVRAWVNDKVREAAATTAIVVDGRDMGTAVFPQARVKIFLIADPWERARRRLIQRLERAPTDDEIAAETETLVARDAADSAQTQQARDAIVLDTTFLTQEEQVERIVALAKRAMRA
jgi:cytidylate kinase